MTNPIIPGVKIFITNESNPWGVELAATDRFGDAISGIAIIDGNQSNVQWVDQGSGVAPLEFRKARGLSEAIALYNRSGVLGGPIEVANSNEVSIPFWVRYRIDENSATRSGFVNFGVALNTDIIISPDATGEDPVDPEPPPPTEQIFVPYNNPSGDLSVMLGSQKNGLGQVTHAGNKVHFTYTDTTSFDYVLDLTPGSGNAEGCIKIYEATTDSWPVWGGGLSYLTKSGVTHTPFTLAAFNTLSFASFQPNKKLVLGFNNSLDGGRNAKYTFQLTGKSLRVTMESLDITNDLYSGNYINASIGIASGVENPYAIEMAGNGMTQFSVFDGPSTDKYFYGNFLDHTQSNCQWAQPPDPRNLDVSPKVDKQYTLTYKQNTTGGIVAPVYEVFNVAVSESSKDLLGMSTAPLSPYYNTLTDKYFVTLALNISGSPTTWANSNESYYNLLQAFDTWGMDQLSIYGYYFWSTVSIANTGNLGPRWMPARNPGELNTVTSFARDKGYQFGLYTIFGTIDSGAYYFSEPITNVDTTGGHKQDSHARNLTSALTINYRPAASIAYVETLEMRNAYNLSAAFQDVETSTWPSVVWDRLDQRTTGNNVKTMREALIYHKLACDAQRSATSGPLLGEGVIAHWNDGGALFHGYLDSTERCVSSNNLVGSATCPTGSPRLNSLWPPIVEAEWYMQQPKAVHHGLGFHERFFSTADLDVLTDPNGGAFSYSYPLGTGALDRVRAFRFSHARAGYSSQNGYVDGIYNYITHEQQVMDYYLTVAVQERMFASPVDNISYYVSGNWSGFDSLIKTSKNIGSLSGAAVRVIFANGFELYVNHNTGSTPLTIANNSLVTKIDISKDGFFARDIKDSFYAFTASATIPGFGTTLGEKISYVYAPDEYEFFHGRSSSCTGFGNITTTGSNTSQMKINNFMRNMTIESRTGASTYPQIVVSSGLFAGISL